VTGEDAMAPHDTADESAGTLAERRTGPGIVVLSVAMQLLYMNQAAHELSRRIQAAAPRPGRSPAAQGVLPETLTALCQDIIAALTVKTEAKDWEQSPIARVAGSADRPILLKGFGLPDAGGLERARIVVTLEPLGRRAASWRDRAQVHYRLTGRETAVLEQLVKGFTNKEIAHVLGITEQTVKEHVKHIMRKTGTTTRTGVLAKVLAPGSSNDANSSGRSGGGGGPDGSER
jgi:DNA-binding CsgD family transcriptional regulator